MAVRLTEAERGRGDIKTFNKNIGIPGDYKTGPHVWRGKTTTNHNTTEGKKYTYGTFNLVDRDGNKAHPGHCAHRISIFVETGFLVPDDFDVVSLVGDYLDVNPAHLGIVDKSLRGAEREAAIIPALQFIAQRRAANDNVAAKSQAAA